jgi:predicted nucleic acid-binding protein
MVQARAVLDAVILMTMPSSVFERAAMLEPALLRSLDALHLAAALELGDDLEGVVTYDRRLAESAEALGIRVVALT